MKEKLNIFSERSPLYDFRWFIVITITAALFMTYHDLNGGRIFTSSGAQQWSSSGPGYHK